MASGEVRVAMVSNPDRLPSTLPKRHASNGGGIDAGGTRDEGEKSWGTDGTGRRGESCVCRTRWGAGGGNCEGEEEMERA